MNTGDVIFVRGDGFISKIVRFFDKGKYSHVAIAVDKYNVIEIDFKMKSKLVDVIKYDGLEQELIETNLSKEQKHKFMEEFPNYLNKNYDYLMVLGLLLKREYNSKRSYICSELVYELLYNVGYFKKPLDGNIAPNKLYDLLKKM